LAGLTDVLTVGLAILAIGLLVRICWTDFFYLKIWNRDLFALLAVTAPFLLIAWPADLILRITLGGILFALSFLFWLSRSLGAGDVKLFGIAGCLISAADALTFVFLILVFALAIIFLYRRTGYLRFIPQVAGRRVLELVDTGRIPYGVPISLATITLLARSLLGGM
jgi:Flp pilus assembly protein protease CpaA